MQVKLILFFNCCLIWNSSYKHRLGYFFLCARQLLIRTAFYLKKLIKICLYLFKLINLYVRPIFINNIAMNKIHRNVLFRLDSQYSVWISFWSIFNVYKHNRKILWFLIFLTVYLFDHLSNWFMQKFSNCHIIHIYY